MSRGAYAKWMCNICPGVDNICGDIGACGKKIDSEKRVNQCPLENDDCIYPQTPLFFEPYKTCDRRINKTYSYLSTNLPWTFNC